MKVELSNSRTSLSAARAMFAKLGGVSGVGRYGNVPDEAPTFAERLRQIAPELGDWTDEVVG